MSVEIEISKTPPDLVAQPRVISDTKQLMQSILDRLQFNGVWRIDFKTRVRKKEHFHFKPLRQDGQSILCLTKPKGNDSCWEIFLTPPQGFILREVISELRQVHPTKLLVNRVIPPKTKEEIADEQYKNRVKNEGRLVRALHELQGHEPSMENVLEELYQDMDATRTIIDPKDVPLCTFALDGKKCNKFAIESMKKRGFIENACEDHAKHPNWKPGKELIWSKPAPTPISIPVPPRPEPEPVLKCNFEGCSKDASQLAGDKTACEEHSKTKRWQIIVDQTHAAGKHVLKSDGTLVEITKRGFLALDPFEFENKKLGESEEAVKKALVAMSMAFDAHGACLRREAIPVIKEHLHLESVIEVSRHYDGLDGAVRAILRALCDQGLISKFPYAASTKNGGKSETTEGYLITPHGRITLANYKVPQEIRQQCFTSRFTEAPTVQQPKIQDLVAANLEVFRSLMREHDELVNSHAEDTSLVHAEEEDIQNSEQNLAITMNQIREIDKRVQALKEEQEALFAKINRDNADLNKRKESLEGFRMDAALKLEKIENIKKKMAETLKSGGTYA